VTESTGSLLQAVAEVARLAGGVAARHFRSPLTVERKLDGSPVTIADREAERAAREWIERRFAGDGILGEEFGAVRADADRRWLLDPIDGTVTFVHGVPLWGTLVAVVEGGDVVAGAAYYPAVEELLTAAPGEGCWWNGSRSTVSQISNVSDATVLTTDERFRSHAKQSAERRAGWHTLAQHAAVSRTWGDCYGYLLVATGRADAMVDPVLSPWDSAVLLPIIEEAGGVFTDWDGRRDAFGGSAIATNQGVAVEVRAILRR
jgi:histidinol phosphatase-like enzyme (inositol monophosphatase family)